MPSSSYKDKPTKRQSIFVIAGLAAIAGLLFGMDTGIMSGALPFLQKEFQLDNAMSGRVVSALMFGGAIGALLAGWLSWHLGRKISMLISALLFLFGAIICGFAPHIYVLLIGRIILGLAIGIASFATPLYLAEIAPEDIRGRMISFYQMLITLGILAAFLIDTAFSYNEAWRHMLSITAIPAFLFLIGTLFLPRSPRWLVAKQRHEEARQILLAVRKEGTDIDAELEDIKSSLTIKQNGWHFFKTNKNFQKSVALGAALQIMQQLTGINIILYYAPKIMQLAGFVTTLQQMWGTVAIGLVNVFFTYIAIKIIDRWGRRPILIMGFALMGISMAMLSALLSLNTNHLWVEYLALFVIFAFIGSFAMSAGPLVWTLCSEIQPLKGRDFGITISTAANWLSNMVLSGIFLSLLGLVGAATSFCILALFNFIFIFVTYQFVPETKNTTLEQIEKNLLQGKKLREIGQSIKG